MNEKKIHDTKIESKNGKILFFFIFDRTKLFFFIKIYEIF